MTEQTACSTEKKCPINCFIKCILVAIPVGLFLMATEYAIHAKWLMALYETTPTLWRIEEDMKTVMGGGMCFLRIAAMALAITVLYCKTKKKACANCSTECKKCPVMHGLCFGTALGVLMGTMMGSSYFWMPISVELGQKWFIAGLLQGIGAGLLLGIICKLCNTMCNKGTGSCSTGSCGSKA